MSLVSSLSGEVTISGELPLWSDDTATLPVKSGAGGGGNPETHGKTGLLLISGEAMGIAYGAGIVGKCLPSTG